MKNFKFVSKHIKKCDKCGQEVSSIEYLTGDKNLICYNAKTGTWSKRVVINGNTETGNSNKRDS